jgi:RNA polymerase sigma-70 factor, ECF subfamily
VDRQSPDELVAMVSESIRGELRRLREHRRSEDLFQEAWCEVLRQWPRLASQFDPSRGALSTWMRAVVRNILIDLLRRERRKGARLVSWGELRRTIEGPSRQVDEDSEAAEAAVKWALQQLKGRVAPQNYALLTWYLLDQRPIREIAERLVMPQRKLRKRLDKMIAKLRPLVATQLLRNVSPRRNASRKTEKKGGGGGQK